MGAEAIRATRRLLREIEATAARDGGMEEDEDGAARPARAFWRRVARGDYGELLDEPVRRVLGETRVTRRLSGLIREHGELTGNAHDKFTEFLRWVLPINPEMTEDEQFDDAMAYAEEHFGPELEAHFGGVPGALEAEGAGGDSFDAVVAARAEATSWAAVHDGDEPGEEE